MSSFEPVDRAVLAPAVSAESLASVTIIIVNYFSGKCLIDCVRSALPQCGQVVVVDNSAIDPADSSVDRVCAVFAGDPRVVVLPQLRNLGFAAACNVGAGASSGEWLLFLNPDCVLADRAVSEMLRAMHANPDAGIVGALLLNPDGSEQAGGRRAVPTPWRSFVRAFGFSRLEHRYPRLFAGFELHGQPLPTSPEPVEAISGACMLVRKEAIDDVGLLDDDYFMHCEDLDWCMRFRKNGWQVLFAPDARVTHEKGTCSHARPFFVEWHKHKGMVRFYRSHFRHQYPGGLMALVVLGVWLRFSLVSAKNLQKHVSSRLSFSRVST